MPVPLLDLQAQYHSIQNELDEAVRGVVRSQRFVLGPAVERLEAELAERIGARHAVACASGTDALLLALRALELPAGTPVLVPAFTFFATAGAVWNAGLRPVFVDVDETSFNVTAETLEAALTPDARVVVPVHLFGQMAEMQPILELARRHELAVLEDAAQSIGAAQRINGAWRAAGSVGTFGAFSFFPTKNLGAFGDGGLMTTNDDVLAERLRKLRVHGGRQMYHHEMVGTNSRLDALQAAVLSAKLPHLDGWTEKRRENARWYDELLGGIDGVVTPVTLPGNRHVFNQYTIRARARAGARAGAGAGARDRLREFLERRGVGTGIYYPVPLHLQECFASLGYGVGDLPVSERLAGEVLSLPIYPELTRAQIEEVAGGIRAFFEGGE
jgi:dTDP-4-amino-4,6-dideoxygalactose transaminase